MPAWSRVSSLDSSLVVCWGLRGSYATRKAKMSKIKRRFCSEAVRVEMWVCPAILRGRLPEAVAPFPFCGRDSVAIPLSCCAGCRGLLQNLHCLTGVCNPEKEYRRIRTGINSAVSIIDVDPRFAETCRSTRQLPRAMTECHPRNLSLGVVCLLAVENRFGQ